jgi:hypothetical protein
MFHNYNYYFLLYIYINKNYPIFIKIEKIYKIKNIMLNFKNYTNLKNKKIYEFSMNSNKLSEIERLENIKNDKQELLEINNMIEKIKQELVELNFDDIIYDITEDDKYYDLEIKYNNKIEKYLTEIINKFGNNQILRKKS